MQTATFYNNQYSKIKEGVAYLTLHGHSKARTFTGKYEAINELMFHNTRIMSEILVTAKHLDLAIQYDCSTEVSYFKKQLALHCYDLLYPRKGGMVNLITTLIRRFNGDLIKPQLLRTLITHRAEVNTICKEYFPCLNKTKHRLKLIDKKGTAHAKYKVADTIDEQQLLNIVNSLLDAFTALNDLLIELTLHLTTTDNKYSGDNY